MTLFIIMVPLMVVAVLIATVPVLYHSVREHHEIHARSDRGSDAQAANGYSIRKVSPTERAMRQAQRERVAA